MPAKKKINGSTSGKLKIRKGDKVIVLTGKDKGKQGEVIRALPKENRVVVSGVNLMKKHQRPTATDQGGIITKEASIHASNVAIADPKNGKASRVGFKLLKDGGKTRIAKKSGEDIIAAN